VEVVVKKHLMLVPVQVLVKNYVQAVKKFKKKVIMKIVNVLIVE